MQAMASLIDLSGEMQNWSSIELPSACSPGLKAPAFSELIICLAQLNRLSVGGPRRESQYSFSGLIPNPVP
jgi:hypothetical protein